MGENRSYERKFQTGLRLQGENDYFTNQLVNSGSRSIRRDFSQPNVRACRLNKRRSIGWNCAVGCLRWNVMRLERVAGWDSYMTHW